MILLLRGFSSQNLLHANQGNALNANFTTIRRSGNMIAAENLNFKLKSVLFINCLVGN